MGLYTSRGGALHKIANGQTPVPGGAETFGGFVGPVLSGNRVAFRGSSELSASGAFGIYSGNTHGLTQIADRQTPVPEGNGTLLFFWNRPVVDGDTVVFPASGSDPGHNGLYSSRNGVLTRLADTGTPVPAGSGNFAFLGTPAVDDGIVAFAGFDQTFRPGIYSSTAGTLARIADSQTTIPGSTTTFGSFGNPVVDNGLVAFGALDSAFNPAGLYASEGGSLITLADLQTPVPGGQGVFSGFGTGPVLGAGSVAFVGGDTTGTQGIYVRRNGTLHKVISATDTLDGKAIAFLQLATGDSCDFFGCFAGYGSGFDGARVAFHVTFGGVTQGLYGIYLAYVSTPMADLSARVDVQSRGFELEASFSLGTGNNGIDPVREGLTLRVGSLSTVVPPDSFRDAGHDGFRFEGMIDGVELDVRISRRAGERHELSATAKGAGLPGVGVQLPVHLAIGDDRGSATAKRD